MPDPEQLLAQSAVDQNLVEKTSEPLVQTGLQASGYSYLVIDGEYSLHDARVRGHTVDIAMDCCYGMNFGSV